MIKNQEGLHEECGVFGVIGHRNASNICYYGLHSLQHRGQEAAGICVKNNQKLMIHKGEGLVTEVFDSQKINQLKGSYISKVFFCPSQRASRRLGRT